MELVRQRPDRLGDQTQRRTPQREFAAQGPKQDAFRVKDVAQIPMLECLMRTGADPFIVHPELQAPFRACSQHVGAVLQGGEARFSLDALQNHSPCDRDPNRVRLQGFAGRSGELSVNLSQLMRRPQVIWKRHPLFAQCA